MDRDILFKTLNVRGLRNVRKRKCIFERSKGMITCIQETHSTEKDEGEWTREWGGKIIFSHGTIQSAGVAILIPNDIEVGEIDRDNEGRIVKVAINIVNEWVDVISVYAPTGDKVRLQKKISGATYRNYWR